MKLQIFKVVLRENQLLNRSTFFFRSYDISFIIKSIQIIKIYNIKYILRFLFKIELKIKPCQLLHAMVPAIISSLY